MLERRLHHLLDRERAARTALTEREAELARLNAQLVEDFRRDPLTGMRNRRALADDLLELGARRDQEGSFAVALCDVDHFKAYNDRLGHLAGDHALRTISAIVRATLRSGDLSYRFGGEELLLILRNTGPEEAHAVAERVRAAVQAAAVPHPDGVGGVVTVRSAWPPGPMTPTACSPVPTPRSMTPSGADATGRSWPPTPPLMRPVDVSTNRPTGRCPATCAAC